jgi:hypothetical protein
VIYGLAYFLRTQVSVSFSKSKRSGDQSRDVSCAQSCDESWD